MRFNDAVIGAGLLVFSVLLMMHVSLGWSWLVDTDFQGFPRAVPGRPGPALFPFTLGILFGICGTILLIRGLKTETIWLEFGNWTKDRIAVLRGLGIISAILVYIFLDETIGFLPLALLIMFLLMKQLGVKTLTAALTSVATSVLIHSFFVKFLLVPLPWGLLAPIAW